MSGDYEQYLSSNNPIFIGQAASEGYFHTTICSNRGNQFAVDYNNHAIPLCVDNLNAILMDDAGGPGDRVKIHIEHEHPFFLPLLSNIWPSVSINAERDGIVEKFRTSRVVGVSGPILSAPTWTQTPTITYTPTITLTPTETPTTTPSITPSPTNTPIPVDCDLITVVNSYVGHWTSGYHIASVTIRNDNPVPIHLYTVNQAWQKNAPGRYYWAAKFNNSSWDILNDTNPPTTWNPSPAIEMIAGGLGDYIGLFQPQYVALEGDTTVDLIFDDGCHKGVTVDMPTSTPTDTPTVTPTPTITPTPDCNNYSMSNFSIKNYAILSMTIRNHDAVDANLISLDFNWDFAEQFGAANGYNNLNVDWFKWAGTYMGDGQGGVRDYDSPTIWNGSVPFNAGIDYRWEIDFDGDWSTGGVWPDIQPSDFSVVARFDNGCILNQNQVPRSVFTWTPTPTPTITPTITPIPPPTSTPLPSNTPLPTNTPLPSLTPTITWTPSVTPIPSDTPVPSHTSWPTNTPIPSWTTIPSNTPLPTSTNTPLPTSTFTPVFTNTPTPIPTWTPACPFDDPNWPCQPTWTPTP